MASQRRKLTVFDRLTIEVRLRDGWGIRAIARDLDRSPGMISDEIRRHGGVAAYQGHAAATQADADRRRVGAWIRISMPGRNGVEVLSYFSVEVLIVPYKANGKRSGVDRLDLN